MLTCPLCKKSLRTMARECPSCHTDLSLLVDFHENQDDSLKRAEERTKAGDLGEAIWAYLEVLEVNPDNPTARQQVGRVVRAIRQFDQIAYRRWRRRQRGQARSRPWLDDIPFTLTWLRITLLILLLAAVLFLGFRWGYHAARPGPAGETSQNSKLLPQQQTSACQLPAGTPVEYSYSRMLCNWPLWHSASPSA